MMSTATSSFDASSSHLGAMALLQASQDDHFRAKLQEDPTSALAQFGITIDAERLPKNVHLPSKQEVEGYLCIDPAVEVYVPFLGD